MELDGAKSEKQQSDQEKVPKAGIVEGSDALREKSGKAQFEQAIKEMDPDRAVEALDTIIEQGSHISEDEVKKVQVVLDQGLENRKNQIAKQFDNDTVRDLSPEHKGQLEETVQKIQKIRKEAGESAKQIIEETEPDEATPELFEDQLNSKEAFKKLPDRFAEFLIEEKGESVGMRDIYEAAITFEQNNPKEGKGVLLKSAFAFEFSTKQILQFSNELTESQREQFLAKLEVPNVPEYNSLTEQERYEMSFEYYREQGLDKKIKDLVGEIERIQNTHGSKEDMDERITELEESLGPNAHPIEKQALQQTKKARRELIEAKKEKELLERSKIFRMNKQELVEKYVENKESIDLRVEEINTAKEKLYDTIEQVLKDEISEAEKYDKNEKAKRFKKRLESLQETREKEAALQSEIIGESELGGGVNRTKAVKLKNNTLPGVYKPRIGESYLARNGFPPNDEAGFMEREVLAHGIDQFFGLDVVPVTVAKNGSDGLGAVSEWVPSVPAVDLKEKGLGDWEGGNKTELQAVGLKDYLSTNVDGNRSNIGVRPDGGYVGYDNGMIAPKRLGRPEIVKRIKSGEIDPNTLDVKDFSNIDLEDNLRSTALEVTAGEQIDQGLLDNIELFVKHRKLSSEMENFFTTLLGEKDGAERFKKLEENVRNIEDQMFANGPATIPESDLDSETLKKISNAGLLGERID